MTDTADTATADLPAATRHGTPVSPRWDADWIAQVDAAEERLQRNICGAHAPNGHPCELDPSHANGRCPYHGGAPNIGAQPGNKNAQTHGLYSRQLRQCDNTCPLWGKCAYAIPQVMDLHPEQRPICPYEQTEFDEALKAYAPPGAKDDPLAEIQTRNIAMLQTIVNRAQRVLSTQNLTTTVETQSIAYSLVTEKISAVADVLLRFHRELRAQRRDLDNRVAPEASEATETAEGESEIRKEAPKKKPLWTEELLEILGDKQYSEDMAEWEEWKDPNIERKPGDPVNTPKPKRENYPVTGHPAVGTGIHITYLEPLLKYMASEARKRST